MKRFKVEGSTGLKKKHERYFRLYKDWPLGSAAESVCALSWAWLARLEREETRPAGQIRLMRINPELPVGPSQLLISFACIFLNSDPAVGFTGSEIAVLFRRSQFEFRCESSDS